jgi:hypothetical protein
MAYAAAVLVPNYQRRKFAPEQLGKLRVSLKESFFGCFIFAAGDRLAARFHALCCGLIDYGIDFTLSLGGFNEGAEGRMRIKFVALGGEACCSGFDYFAETLILSIHVVPRNSNLDYGFILGFGNF